MAGKTESKATSRLDALDQKTVIESKAAYQAELEALQDRLVLAQRAIYQQGQRVILVFEGCDAAGKGGAIRRLTEPLDPRGFTVHPIGPPRPDEQGRHYLYRFWRRLPLPGRISIFDRSWYGRVLVEKVERLIDERAAERSYEEINEFERTLTDDGVIFVKIYLHITKDEQLTRFAERLTNPFKRWKISDDDVRNRENWGAYCRAAEAMFEKTETKTNPWHVIAGNHKWHARLEVMRTVVGTLESRISVNHPPVDLVKLTEIAKRLGLERLLPLERAPRK